MDYSVITICLNSVNTLANTVNSVLNQTVLPKQYIFVDGGSNDGTLELISDLEAELMESSIDVLIINQEIVDKDVAGIPHAWNLGICKVTSDIVFILNSDDWYGDASLASKVLDSFQDNDFDAVVGNVNMRTTLDKSSSGKLIKNKPSFFLPIMNPFNHPAFFVRLSTYQKLGDYDCSYPISSDYDFMYRVHIGGKIKLSSNILVDRLPGGWASDHLSEGRHETYIIGKTRSNSSLWPLLALFVRKLFNR